MRLILTAPEHLGSLPQDATTLVAPAARVKSPGARDSALRAWRLKTLPIGIDPSHMEPVDPQAWRAALKQGLPDTLLVVGEVPLTQVAVVCHHLGNTPQVLHAPDGDLSSAKPVSPSALDAAWLRLAWQWLVGLNGTRAATKRLPRKAGKPPWVVGAARTALLLSTTIETERAERVDTLVDHGETREAAGESVEQLLKGGYLEKVGSTRLTLSSRGRILVHALVVAEVPHLDLADLKAHHATLALVAAGEADAAAVFQQMMVDVTAMVDAMRSMEPAAYNGPPEADPAHAPHDRVLSRQVFEIGVDTQGAVVSLRTDKHGEVLVLDGLRYGAEEKLPAWLARCHRFQRNHYSFNEYERVIRPETPFMASELSAKERARAEQLRIGLDISALDTLDIGPELAGHPGPRRIRPT